MLTKEFSIVEQNLSNILLYSCMNAICTMYYFIKIVCAYLTLTFRGMHSITLGLAVILDQMTSGVHAGTYFYHGHLGLQRSAGFYGSLIVDVAKGEKEPSSTTGS